ncbi:MAG: TonB-dependent receptor plug domain-containing protein, partial [Gemmatimonadetes bacterium]|nr:TonB-dependent receptor plug domain-containing protein [Gemmatimonadota bacterium]
PIPDQVATTPMQQMLAARAPGLDFTRSSADGEPGSAVRIRGFSDILINNQPLIYVDGIRIGTSFGDAGDSGASGGSALDHINPDDIESIEIIKGPAAETLYGSMASGGVIQITTKAGKPIDGSG